ncbi:hypothetical protein QT995_23470 [Microcoleus sp. S36b_A3]|uniref:hypothetical protein n=1 Tax=unclassified Microcoleus TaxID=2642155 RepID=UPI002FD5C3C4
MLIIYESFHNLAADVGGFTRMDEDKSGVGGEKSGFSEIVRRSEKPGFCEDIRLDAKILEKTQFLSGIALNDGFAADFDLPAALCDRYERATEYGRLLNEALEIGMSVHKELIKLKNER